MAEPEWEVARLIARLDPALPGRLRDRHPSEGRCRPCGTDAPCSSRTLAEAALRLVGTPGRIGER